MSISVKYRNQSLYEHCNKCNANWQDPSTMCKEKSVQVRNCPFKKSHVFVSRLYNPITKRIGKVRTHGKDFKQAWENNLFLIREYETNGYEIETRKKEDVFPKILTEGIALYIDYLNDEPSLVPAQEVKNRSTKYIKDNVRYLKYFLDCLALKTKPSQVYLTAITKKHVSDFHTYLENKGTGNRTYNANIDALQYCFDYLIRRGKLEIENPFTNVTRKQLKTDPRSLSDEQIRKLLSVVTPENGIGVKGKGKVNHWLPELDLFFKASLLLGSRISEILSIEVKHVLTERTIIRVPAADKSKKEFDDTPIFRDLAKVLTEMNFDPSREGYLFYPQFRYRKSLANRLSKSYKHYARLAGVEWSTFHTLRKTWITRMNVLFGETGMKNDKDIANKHYIEQAEKVKGYSKEAIFFEG